MEYVVKWHRVSEELPAPYANCYLAVLAEPDDLKFTVTTGYYDKAADVFVEDGTNANIPVENVWYWTVQLTPWAEEAER